MVRKKKKDLLLSHSYQKNLEKSAKTFINILQYRLKIEPIGLMSKWRVTHVGINFSVEGNDIHKLVDEVVYNWRQYEEKKKDSILMKELEF